MTKRLGGKLLSVILTIAICLSTVLGCLITANAAEGVDSCYSWSESTVAGDLKRATIELTLNAPANLSGGITEAVFNFNSAEWAISKIDITNGACVSGEFDAANYSVSFDGNKVDFATTPVDANVDSDTLSVSNVTLQFALTFKNGTAESGEYDITISELNMGNSYEAYNHTAAAVSGVISVGCEHVIAVKGDPINIDTANGYAVYEKSYCTICGEEFSYQLVPSTESMNEKTITWNGKTEAMALTEEGSATDPYIVQNAEQLAWLVSEATIAQTHEKHFRIADGIDNIVLQSSGADAIMAIDSAEAAQTYLSNDENDITNWVFNDGSTTLFCGHFDGNGVTVYGLKVDAGPSVGNVTRGLFSHIGVGSSLSNINIENSFGESQSDSVVGMLFGRTRPYTYNDVRRENTSISESSQGKDLNGDGDTNDWISYSVENGFVTVNNIKVANSKIHIYNKWWSINQNNGLIGGRVENFTPIHIDGCIVYGSDIEYTGTWSKNKPVLFGYIDNDGPAKGSNEGPKLDGCYIRNALILDAEILAHTNTNNNLHHINFVKTAYSAVYTNVSTNIGSEKRLQYKDDVIVESNDTAYFINTTEKQTASAGEFKIIESADAAKGYSAVENCPKLAWGTTWSYGADGEYPSLTQGSLNTICWDGTTEPMALTEAGDETDPYIIQNAEQLAWLVSEATPAQTFDKHFKMKDGIKNIVLQASGAAEIMALDNVAEVKDYLSGKTAWKENDGTNTLFCGHFNGNGAAIYGMYVNGGALFSYIGLGATVKNLAVYNSYCYSLKGESSAILIRKVMSFTLPDGTKVANTSVAKNELTDGKDYDKNGKIEDKNVWVSSSHEKGYFTIENVEIANCKLILDNAWWYRQETIGILVGSTSGTFAPPYLSGLFIHGNDMEYTGTFAESATYPKYNVLFGYVDNDNPATVPFEGEGVEEPYMRNSLILDAYIAANINGNNELSKAVGYSAVYTNMSESNSTFTPTQYKDDKYYSGGTSGTTKHTVVSTDTVSAGGGFKVIDTGDNNANIFGLAAKTACPNLEWGTEWYANMNGYPTLAAIDKARVAKTSNGKMELIGSNMSYNDDGTLDFNFHFKPVEGYTPTFYVGKVDKTGVTEFITLTTPTASSKRADLGEDAMMFTIPRLAARDVNTIWLPTLVATNGAVTEWGMSQKLSLGQYAEAILSGNVVYETESDKEKYELADKKVAAALLNYADAATTALEAENDAQASKNKIVYYTDGWGVKPELLDPNNPNSKDNPYIIDTAEKLLYIVHKTATEVGVATEKQYYKVPDDIKAFVLQSKDRVDKAGGIDELMNLDAEGVMKWFDDPNKTAIYNTSGGFTNHIISNTINVNGNDIAWKSFDNSTSSSTPFMGEFDGNGVTIYGYYSKNSNSLFGTLKGATIKNVNIKSSYVVGFGGALIAHGATGGSMDIRNTIENCTVSNSCVVTSRQPAAQPHQTAGVMVGAMSSDALSINNCVVNDVIAYNYGVDRTDGADPKSAVALGDTYYYSENGWKAKGNTLSVLGNFYNSDANHISNVLALGLYLHVSPYDDWQNAGGKTVCFSNCYTDMPTTAKNGLAFANNSAINYTEAQIKQITDLESLKGKNAESTLSLDFDSNWMITSGYPQPIQSGYTATGGKTLYWNGGRDTDLTDEEHDYSTQDGTADNPIIIDSAEELAYIAGDTRNYSKTGTPLVTQFYETAADGTITLTGPKHFKIADGIDKIVLQNSNYSEILNLTDSEKVRKYFAGETGVSGFTTWAGCGGWNGDTTYDKMDSFCGAFDGNGVEIYGIYQNSALYGGLFGDVREDATIENVTVKNSYIVNNTTEGYRVGGIVGYSDSNNQAGEKITLSKCIVTNCYLAVYQNVSTDVGHLVGQLQSQNAIISDCAVYGNQAWYDVASGSPKAATFIGNVQSSNVTRISDTIVLDAVPYGNNTSSNAVFSNVYTDAEIADTYTNITTVTNTNNLKGSKAADFVSALNGDNGTTWYVGAAGDYPGFEAAGTMPSWLQSEYDSFSFGAFNNYSANKIESADGNSVIRLKTAGFNLGANPYMSFVFSITGEYLTNRDKINITFKVNGSELHTTTVPTYTAEKTDDKWINNAGSTNHTYQFDNIPVSAFIKDVEVYASYDGAEAVKLGTVSAEGLATSFINASKKTPCSYYTKTAEAAKAVYFYAVMVNERITL